MQYDQLLLAARALCDPVGSHFSSLPTSPSVGSGHRTEKPDVRFAKVRKNNAQFSISEKTQLKNSSKSALGLLIGFGMHLAF